MAGCSGCARLSPAQRSRPSDAKLGITRQGATKVVGHLRDAGYVAVADSATSRREKSVTLTSRGNDYLQAQRTAAR